MANDQPMCRDCADFGPICPNSGKPCDSAATPAAPSQGVMERLAMRDAFDRQTNLCWMNPPRSEEILWEKAWKAGRAYAALPHSAPVAALAPASEAVALTKESLTDLIEEHLYGVYHCGRVWDAWNVGTMSQDDFTEARGSDLAPDLADAILAKLTPTPGDSADAPVQKAGEAEPTRDDNELASDFEHRLNAWHKERAALKGEQPVEPSGTERGEV